MQSQDPFKPSSKVRRSEIGAGNDQGKEAEGDHDSQDQEASDLDQSKVTIRRGKEKKDKGKTTQSTSGSASNNLKPKPPPSFYDILPEPSKPASTPTLDSNTFIMDSSSYGGNGGGGKTSLSEGMKLKGAENWKSWKTSMQDLALGQSLDVHISAEGSLYAPKDKINPYDPSVSELQKNAYYNWTSGDANMRLYIRINIKSSIALALVENCATAYEMWNVLCKTYEGSGPVLEVNAFNAWRHIKYEDYSSLEEFLVAFNRAMDKINALNITVVKMHILSFLDTVAKAHPV